MDLGIGLGSAASRMRGMHIGLRTGIRGPPYARALQRSACLPSSQWHDVVAILAEAFGDLGGQTIATTVIVTSQSANSSFYQLLALLCHT